jgi:hypothetical protein
LEDKKHFNTLHVRDLYGWDKTRDLAVATFTKNKPTMMHVAVHVLESDLKLKEAV